MYLEHFNLHTLPFRLSPDPHFLFLSKQHSRAKSYMESTVWFTDGFVIITGEIGAGKTTLIETFLGELPEDVVVAQINQTHVSARSFLEMLAAEFGVPCFGKRKSEVLVTLSEYLTDQFAAGKKVLLIVDEAQNLSINVLEEIRMLSGIETSTEKVLRIVLAGQPELNDKLNSPQLIQLMQRVRFRFHLSAMNRQEISQYIDHRLQIAGSGGRAIFADDVFDMIYRCTTGIPRLVNTLCDTAMMAAYSEDKAQVTLTEIEQALAELQWEIQDDDPPVASNGVAAGDSAQKRTYGKITLTLEGKPVMDVPLGIGRLIIGRTPENDLRIESRFVSRHHCQIITRPDGTMIEDLNSTNGVFIRDRRVRRYRLKHGDAIQLGKHELIYDAEWTGTEAAAGPAHTAAPALTQSPSPAPPAVAPTPARAAAPAVSHTPAPTPPVAPAVAPARTAPPSAAHAPAQAPAPAAPAQAQPAAAPANRDRKKLRAT